MYNKDLALETFSVLSNPTESSWLRHINGHKDGDCVYYTCLVSDYYRARAVWGERSMNLDKCFCLRPIYPKEQPTNFH